MIRLTFTASLLFAMFSLFLSGTLSSTEDKFTVKISLGNIEKDIEVIRKGDFDIALLDRTQKTIDLVVDNTDLERLEALGFEPIQVQAVTPSRPSASYKTPHEIEALLKKYALDYPQISSLVQIGSSLENRAIWALKISDDPETEDPDEPAILFNALHHAREVMTPEAALDIANLLLTQYGQDDQVTGWVNNTEIWVVPMVNPDGSNKVWTGNSMWRKNTRAPNGVDINRNYPYRWGECNGSSGSQWSQTYRGKAPGSEPETQAIMDLVAKTKPVFSISFHSYGEMVLYPYGCQGARTVNKDVVEGVGKEMARLTKRENGRGTYRAGTAWEIIYSVSGDDSDWMYAEHQVIPYVMEIAKAFAPSYSKTGPTLKRLQPAWQFLLNRMNQTGYAGRVQYQMAPFSSFDILIEKADNGRFKKHQVYQGNPDGSFHVMLTPGEYRFTFKSSESTLATRTIVLGKELITENFSF